MTPDSYNSFLGVIRTINEHLEWRHRAFVVEMGMFRRGDIAELCELVHPKIGVITAIGPMHLERLGSIEQIAAAKGELLDALPADGHFVTNADDPRCLELAAPHGARDIVRDPSTAEASRPTGTPAAQRSGHSPRHKARPTVLPKHSSSGVNSRRTSRHAQSIPKKHTRSAGHRK